MLLDEDLDKIFLRRKRNLQDGEKRSIPDSLYPLGKDMSYVHAKHVSKIQRVSYSCKIVIFADRILSLISLDEYVIEKNIRNNSSCIMHRIEDENIIKSILFLLYIIAFSVVFCKNNIYVWAENPVLHRSPRYRYPYIFNL